MITAVVLIKATELRRADGDRFSDVCWDVFKEAEGLYVVPVATAVSCGGKGGGALDNPPKRRRAVHSLNKDSPTGSTQ